MTLCSQLRKLAGYVAGFGAPGSAGARWFGFHDRCITAEAGFPWTAFVSFIPASIQR